MTPLSKIVELFIRLTENGEHAIVIDWDHQRTHDKKKFTAHYQNIVTNIGEQTVIAFNAPASAVAHPIFTVQSTHNADVFLYRDTSIDDDEGTDLAVVNRNQIAPLGASLLTSITNPPVADVITSFNEAQAASANITTTSELDHVNLIGGSGPLALGAEAIGRNEWNFGESVQVAVVISALTNDDATHAIRADWYEKE